MLFRFNNDPCDGAGNRNGTCYTSAECESRGGANQGSCAQGYGVCCVFAVAECGRTTTENCTYFETPTPLSAGPTSCGFTVCPCTSNICQLRLDFETFLITGPSIDVTSIGTITSGQLPISAGAIPATTVGQCLTDTFALTSPGGDAPPVICGANNGEHCNRLYLT